MVGVVGSDELLFGKFRRQYNRPQQHFYLQNIRSMYPRMEEQLIN